jgi:hypothetical protein
MALNMLRAENTIRLKQEIAAMGNSYMEMVSLASLKA